MPTYKLTYFDIQGRAELPRLLFVAAGKSFEDKRVAFSDWPKFKPSTPNGAMPILEIDGKQYTQSIAIAKYLAREFNLTGKTSIEELRLDEILLITEDFMQIVGKALFTKDDTKRKELNEKLINVDAPRFAKLLEQFLTENGTGYFIGNSLTAADIGVYQMFDDIITKQGEAVLKDTPKVLANRKHVEANSKIANYLKTRK